MAIATEKGMVPPGADPTRRLRSEQDAFIRYEPAPLTALTRLSSYPWLVVGTVCIGAFMGQLDTSIAQLVLPTLETAFHSPLRMVSWVSLAYLLALAGTLPIFGRLADMVGRKVLYTGGFLLFVLGSALCGLAPTLPWLIAARVFQALGAGLLQANSLAIITTAVGPERRGRALGIQGAAQAIGLSTGPALGGLLIQTLGWRWVFWINVPFGLLGVLLGWLVLPRTQALAPRQRFDWQGALLLAPALTALLLALSEGRYWGAVSPATLGCVGVGAVALVLFIRRERSAVSPLIDLALFRSAAFTAGNLAGLLSYGLLFGLFFLLPFTLQRADHTSPFVAGLILTAVPLALGVAAPVAGALSDRFGPRPLTVTGMLLAGIAIVLLSRAGAGALLPVTGALVLFGAGQGLFTAPNNSAIMGAAPATRVGAAGGILNVTRTLGTSLGVALATLLLSWRLAVHAGHSESTASAPGALVTAASHDTLVAFALMAFVAAGISLMRIDDTRMKREG
jgi:EmrB/QacA subfamily drug resistance transporter